MKAGLVYAPVYLKHDTGLHVENALRLEAILARLEESGVAGELVALEPRPATVAEIALVHEMSYIAYIREAAQEGEGWLDPDTRVSSGSYEAAVYAAGGAIRAAEAVLDGVVNSAFALVRPPGHHATARQAMGFCLFNNVAIATRYAMPKYGLERAAIIDFDVHHGNGTQEAFYHDANVLYISTHESPLYPGTGMIGETGGEHARGSNVNIPLPAGCGDAEYRAAFDRIIAPVVRRFKPQIILVSAGYDPHWTEELAMMQVSVAGFAGIVGVIKGLADELCRGRLVFCLEGGYNLAALAASVKATFDILLGKTKVEDPLGPSQRRTRPPDIDDLLDEIKKVHQLS